jgi:hypothetical protein
VHGLSQYIILICCPLEDQDESYAGKISHLLNELSHMKTQYHQAYGPANTVQYFLNPSVVPRDELLRLKAIADDALYEYEKGLEHLPEIEDAELRAARTKRDAFGDEYWDSELGMQAATELENLWFRKMVKQFVEEFLPTIPKDVQKRRMELTAQIQERLTLCRQCRSWDDRSEYKLAQWLGWVAEEEIPYVSLPELIRLKRDMERYYNIHSAMDEQMCKQNKQSPYDLKGQSPASTLSEKAQDLLLNAGSDKLGIMMIVRTTNGTFVQTNSRQFVDVQNARSEVECLAAIKELVEGGHLENLPGETESFRVTATGYSAIDDLRDVRAAVLPAATV